MFVLFDIDVAHTNCTLSLLILRLCASNVNVKRIKGNGKCQRYNYELA